MLIQVNITPGYCSSRGISGLAYYLKHVFKGSKESLGIRKGTCQKAKISCVPRPLCNSQ